MITVVLYHFKSRPLFKKRNFLPSDRVGATSEMDSMKMGAISAMLIRARFAALLESQTIVRLWLEYWKKKRIRKSFDN